MEHTTKIHVYLLVHKYVHLSGHYTERMVEHTSGRRPGKTELVYRQLKAEIEDGIFLPGQDLPEAVLVEHTGASRTPVREALRKLAAEGLVDLEPRRAATVARISLRSVRELFDYRRILEPASIRLVVAEASRSSDIREVFSGLQGQLEQLAGEEYSREFAQRFRELTAEFDLALVRFTPNAHLYRAISDLRPHTARLRRIAHMEQGRLGESIREHVAMCGHIISGDADAAARELGAHLTHVHDAIIQALLSGRQDTRTGAAVDLVS